GMGASTLTVAFGVFFCIQGLAQSTGWGPLIKNMSAFFSRRERGGIMGLWSTCYPLGGFFASVLAGWAGDQFGWRYAFYVPAAALCDPLLGPKVSQCPSGQRDGRVGDH